MIFPRVEQVDEEYFLTLSLTPEDSDRSRMDPERWEPVKLSAYFLA
ncbi:hypothetical protein [Arthrobacter sp. Marseille-P9274]|nr:hypothetical protein [Arthrobacter sp. Marseille-P9274]